MAAPLFGPTGWWCLLLFLQDPQSWSLTLLEDPDQAKEAYLPIRPPGLLSGVCVAGVLAGSCKADGGLWPPL